MTEEKRPEFTIKVGEDGIIHLALYGRVGREYLTGLSSWAEEVKRVVKREYEKSGGKIKIITNISELENYHPEALSILANLLKDNKPYVERSATFGGSALIIMAQDIITALSGRENFKAFKTEEEALAWLKQ